MLPTIRLDHEFSRLIADLSNLQRNQLPYATAVALTRTAQDIQKAEQDSLA